MPEMSGTNKLADNGDLTDFVMNGGTWADKVDSAKSADIGGSGPSTKPSPETDLRLDGEMLIDLGGPSLREEAQRAEAAKAGGSPEVPETTTGAKAGGSPEVLEPRSPEPTNSEPHSEPSHGDSPEVPETNSEPHAEPADRLAGDPKLAKVIMDAARRVEHYLKDGAGILGLELGSSRKGIRLFAGALQAAGVTPTPGEVMKLYLARNSEEFKSGKIVGNDTEMGALDIGRLKAVNTYTQMGLKNSLIREFSSIRRPFGTIGEDELKEIGKRVEIVADLKDGKITRDGEFVKTKIKEDDLISGILEGKESAAFKKIEDAKGKLVGWELANGKILTEDGRQSIAAKIVSAHFEGSSALEYKGDQIIDAVAIEEGWKPVQINRFKESLEGNMRSDGTISTQGQSWLGDILKVLELTIKKGG